MNCAKAMPENPTKIIGIRFRGLSSLLCDLERQESAGSGVLGLMTPPTPGHVWSVTGLCGRRGQPRARPLAAVRPGVQ
jgi:hypothetical protein